MCSQSPACSREHLVRHNHQLLPPTCCHHQQWVAALQASHEVDVLRVEQRGKAAGEQGVGLRCIGCSRRAAGDCSASAVPGGLLTVAVHADRVADGRRRASLPATCPHPSPATRLTSIIAPGPSSASTRSSPSPAPRNAGRFGAAMGRCEQSGGVARTTHCTTEWMRQSCVLQERWPPGNHGERLERSSPPTHRCG